MQQYAEVCSESDATVYSVIMLAVKACFSWLLCLYMASFPDLEKAGAACLLSSEHSRCMPLQLNGDII